MKVIKKGFSIMFSILLWGIILLAALFAFTTLATKDQSQVASLGGYTPMVVKSDSMAPTFLSGDLILIKKCDTSRLEEGDIICFHTIINNEYALNTHRIFEINEVNGVRSYKTKGDNNEISDSHIISDGDIVGQYIGKVSRLGTVMDFLSSSTGFLIVIVLPMLLFFIYQVYHLVMVTISLKKAVAAEEAAKAAEAEEAAKEQQKSIQPTVKPAEECQTPGQNVSAAAVNDTAEEEAAARAREETEAILAEAQKIRAEAEAAKARAEAEKALAEAKRMKAEAEAALAKVRAEKEDRSV
ncbi:MAG: signal peptidase I [Lachnospiraceae bacterium]|nr:signal peptidase I [Lachnospiraceae bacterium]